METSGAGPADVAAAARAYDLGTLHAPPVSAARGQQGVVWRVELAPPGPTMASGFTEDTVKPGDEVRVSVRPLKNGDPGGLFVSVTLADGRTLTERPVLAQAAPASPQ